MENSRRKIQTYNINQEISKQATETSEDCDQEALKQAKMKKSQ